MPSVIILQKIIFDMKKTAKRKSFILSSGEGVCAQRVPQGWPKAGGLREGAQAPSPIDDLFRSLGFSIYCLKLKNNFYSAECRIG
jgi:hypothetical protein